MEAVKEAISYVPSDFVSEMRSTKRRRQVNGCQATPVEYVLPDYKNVMKVSGYYCFNFITTHPNSVVLKKQKICMIR